MMMRITWLTHIKQVFSIIIMIPQKLIYQKKSLNCIAPSDFFIYIFTDITRLSDFKEQTVVLGFWKAIYDVI